MEQGHLPCVVLSHVGITLEPAPASPADVPWHKWLRSVVKFRRVRAPAAALFILVYASHDEYCTITLDGNITRVTNLALLTAPPWCSTRGLVKVQCYPNLARDILLVPPAFVPIHLALAFFATLGPLSAAPPFFERGISAELCFRRNDLRPLAVRSPSKRIGFALLPLGAK